MEVAVMNEKDPISAICRDIRNGVLRKLLLQPQMNLKTVEEMLESAISTALNYFEAFYDDHPGVNVEEQKGILKLKLNEMGERILEKHKVRLEENAKEEDQKKAEEVSHPVASTSQSVRNISRSSIKDGTRGHYSVSTAEGLRLKLAKVRASIETKHAIASSSAASSHVSVPAPRETIETASPPPSSSLSNEATPVVGEMVSKGPIEKSLADGGDGNAKKLVSFASDDDIDSSPPATVKKAKLDVPVEPPQSSNSAEAMFPLVFRLGSDRITVGTKIGDTFQILLSPQGGDLFLLPVVGVDDAGRLTWGIDAMKCGEYWCLGHFLEDVKSPRKKMTFKGKEVTLEWLIAVIMGKLKICAESFLQMSFKGAYVIVPFWLCSTQRIQVKDGAAIAGFTDVYLVNQESLGAYSLALKQNGKCDILALSFNFGIISVIFYEWNKRHRTLTMKQHECSTSLPLPKDSLARKTEVNRLCFPVLVEISSKLKVAVLLTDFMEWKDVFMEVIKEKGIQLGTPPLSSFDLFGATVLCDPEQKAKGLVMEYPPPFMYSIGDDDSSNKHVNLFGAKSVLALMESLECQLPLEVFKSGRNATFSQVSYPHQKKVVVGEVKFHGNSHQLPRSAAMLILNFGITLEGVITLKGKRIKDLGKGEKSVSAEQFTWTTRNMSADGKEEMKGVISAVLQRGGN